MLDNPTVSLVIVNLNGDQHLRACLDSVGELDLGRTRLETLVVDNASTDGSVDLVHRHYPWVRVLPQSENLGFAAGVSAGAQVANGEYLALCNNDMRLDRGWLRELLSACDSAARVACVGGTILDWEGEKVDFVGGFVNLHGFAGQEHFGEPFDNVLVDDGRELPFACGGSMLVDRELFLELGGFDPSYFALLEDVDFGWRLALAGHTTRLAARARSYHRHGATTGTLPSAERRFLFERNALLTILKNVDDENLARFLAFALFLLAQREADSDAPGPGIRAVSDVLGRLGSVLEERARVQRLRRRSDAEVISRFGRPFVAVDAEPRYLEAAALLARLLRLDELASEPGRKGADPTEEIRQLLDAWRDRYGVDRSASWHISRALARSLPAPVRRAAERARRARQ